ncbi:GNAT family N-acetyltransferase [Streptomyces catenulae]|uniref:GNAT family N-acetyltransferase n=1 Tax=Streptomyces catenulae TaxID=66875 RepID=UPI00068F39D8
MTTATRPPAVLAASPGAPAAPWQGAAAFTVRPGREDDGPALAALSRPFVRTGALRERPLAHYLSEASGFHVAQAADGTLEGCLGLGEYPGAGVLYNFCVAEHRQGSGMGGRLLHAALTRAGSRALTTLFTATTGSGRLFLRHGFAPVSPNLAPRAWARSLDPARGARVLARTL